MNSYDSSMKTPKKFSEAAPAARAALDILRDPALWAWLVVALLAIIPARSLLTHERGDDAAVSHRQDVKAPS